MRKEKEEIKRGEEIKEKRRRGDKGWKGEGRARGRRSKRRGKERSAKVKKDRRGKINVETGKYEENGRKGRVEEGPVRKWRKE